MTHTLQIASNLSLPLEAVTETFAILAIRGVGKTHTASIMAEEMIKAGQPVCIYDPTGAWFGLKTSKDGKHPGFSVVIFGGEHADVPLEETAGGLIARVIVDRRISAILDVSLLRKAARVRFMTQFLEELYHRNREALHLFLDEAHTIAPQNLRNFPEAAPLVGALEDIVLQGRRKGLGVTAITQRPALLNTNIRTQCGTVIVMRVVGPHDRKAILEWIEAHATTETAKEMLDSLATLKRGEGWVWSPGWLDLFVRVKFRDRETFDSSATPKVGQRAAVPQVVAEIDLAKLGAEIAATVEKAKADDPKALRRRIAELEKEINKEAGRASQPNEQQSRQIESLTARVKELEQYSSGLAKTVDNARLTIEQIGKLCASMMPPVLIVPGDVDLSKVDWTKHQGKIEYTPDRTPTIIPRPQRAVTAHQNGSSPALRAGARRMLACLCQWFPSGRTESQVAAQVQMKKTGGTWAAYKSDLKQGGYIVVGGDGLWYATEEGVNVLGANIPDTPTTTEEVVALWGEKLRKGAREMLAVLVNHKGRPVPREDLGQAVNMEPSGGTFAAYLSDLKQAGLIVVDRDGVRANEETLLL